MARSTIQDWEVHLVFDVLDKFFLFLFFFLGGGDCNKHYEYTQVGPMALELRCGSRQILKSNLNVPPKKW